MRKGWREALGVASLALLAMAVRVWAAEPQQGEAPARLTIEVDWALPPELPGVAPGQRASEVALEVPGGRVLGVVARPASGETAGPDTTREGVCRLGTGRAGKARARVEVPVGANLLVRAGGQVVQFPVLNLLDGPLQTAPPAAVSVTVRRLPWDALEVSLPGGDGTAAPGATVPVSLAFNILTPEATEVAVGLTAELRAARGEEVLWRHEDRLAVTTNTLVRPGLQVAVPLPQAEGTYVLEVRSTWEPVARVESSRLGRWLRRRRAAGVAATTSVRRVSLAVVNQGPVGDQVVGADAVVDSVDLTRTRVHRAWASGRSAALGTERPAWPVPESALAEPRRIDRIRGLIGRGGSEVGVLAPADPTGLAWSALALKVSHPGRPHRLTLTVTGGHPAALGVALVAPPAGPDERPRLFLDACAAGMPILEGGPMEAFSWLVWPETVDPILVFLNRGSTQVRLGVVELTELADLPPAPAIAPVQASAARGFGLHLGAPGALDRFGGLIEGGPPDVLGLARNLSSYAASAGASLVVLPDGLAERSRRLALEGQAEEDCVGPDRLDLILRVLEGRNLSAWIDVRLDGPLPGLPAPSSPEALARGLVCLDRRGLVDEPAYHPLNLEVRDALAQRLTAAIAARKARPALSGLLVRLGPCPTLLGGPDTGFDDATFAQFARATGLDGAGNLPGHGADDPNRFASREQFLSGPGRMPWLTWRSREIGALYAGLARAVAEASPGATLAVATPGLDDGPAGQEARKSDHAGLPPPDAWRAVGLDLEQWPTTERALVVLRAVGLSTGDLAHDLATSPELDAQVVTRPRRGALLGIDELERRAPHALALVATPLAEGPAGDELLGHALAALDARWVVVAAPSAAGEEDRMRRFATVFRAIPTADDTGSTPARLPSGVAVRAIESGQNTYIAMANDTPYPTRLEAVLATAGAASVTDLGRGLQLAPADVPGGKQLVLDLAPFGVAAVRVAAPAARVAAVKPHHHATVLASVEARKDDLSRALLRLSRAAQPGDTGPPSPGFEPGIELTGVNELPHPNGWHTAGNPATSIAIDPVRPHSGQGCLRLEAPAAPGAVMSDSFVPPTGAELTLRAWVRAEKPDTQLRLLLEGEQAGRPFTHQVDLTAQPYWSACVIPVRELPPGGLDQARLRFELPVAGRLWVDDLSVAGEGLSEPERRNARRTLLAALQAYRDGRFADFARLAGSHWTRQAEPPARIAGRETDRAGQRPGDSSPLPPGRRLR
jgi:hypothetical protein